MSAQTRARAARAAVRRYEAKWEERSSGRWCQLCWTCPGDVELYELGIRAADAIAEQGQEPWCWGVAR